MKLGKGLKKRLIEKLDLKPFISTYVENLTEAYQKGVKDAYNGCVDEQRFQSEMEIKCNDTESFRKLL